MALTVVKYRKPATGEPSSPSIIIKKKPVQIQQQQQLQTVKKPVIKIEGGSGLVINKIPAVVKPSMKRSNTAAAVGGIEPVLKSAKYSLQTVSSTGSPLTSFQWQQTIGGPGGTTITSTIGSKKNAQQPTVVSSINALPANTYIQTAGGSASGIVSTSNTTVVQSNGSLIPTGSTFSTQQGSTIRRPTIYIKRELPKRTIRSITLEMVEKNTMVHMGIPSDRLDLLKNIICGVTGVTIDDCYLTLKKLRQNEDLPLLAEYFELTESEVQHVFARTVVRLARYLRFLIRWPDSKRYYDRHKNLPFAFRANLSHVQSLIDCVETDLSRSLQLSCANYKYILSIMPNGIISYVSDAYVGEHDDLAIFTATNFKSVIPKYLSLVADPGKAVRHKRKPKKKLKQESNADLDTDSNTDSADESVEADEDNKPTPLSKYAAARVAGELASHQTMNVVNSELVSRNAKSLSIPTMRVREPVCRVQLRQMVTRLQEFKILQPCAIQEAFILQFLNEILIVSAALTNLQR